MSYALDLDRVRLHVEIERWPLRETFRIARGGKTEAVVLVATASLDGHVGRGEGVPYARYGEGPEAAMALGARTHATEVDALGSGALKNALSSALLDLEAKCTRVPVHERLGLPAPAPVALAATISIDAPEVMATRARAAGPLLKLKLAGDGLDRARIAAVHAARPDARLWLDANEGLDPETLASLTPELVSCGAVLLEQPLPEGRDEVLVSRSFPFPVCADESAHDAASLASLGNRYDAVNVKLDKTGGLHEALRTIDAARALGMKVVLGCMVSTSLSIAPAQLLAPRCDFVDLDGALFLAKDREGGVRLEDGQLLPATLWGA